MIIGIDADGVLTDLAKFQREYGQKYFGRKPDRETAYNISEMFLCSKMREFLFGTKYFITYCKVWPPREGAVEVIQQLNAEGHKLFEITARKFVTMKNPIGWYSKNMFEEWLDKNGISFANIFYCSEKNTLEQKYEVCKNVSVDIMIDDRPEVALYLADRSVKVLLFDAPYNQEVTHKNICRVFSWREIYRIIDKTKGLLPPTS